MNQTTFFSIPNLMAQEVTPITDPWNFDVSKAPWDWEKSKWDTEFLSNGATDHCLLSLCEGVMPSLRVGDNNPVCCVHGIFADYDGAIPDDALPTLKTKAPSAYRPAYFVVTKSHKAKLYWLFERPVRVTGTDHAKRFISYAASCVKASRWLAGYDTSSKNPLQFEDIGRRWSPTAFADYRIKTDVLNMWDSEVFQKMLAADRVSSGRIEVPMADIKEEMRNRGWGARVSDVKEGAHCRRFWDDNSDNDRGCLITKAGVLVFVPHDKPFMSWADIFGKGFTDKYESEKFRALQREYYWDAYKGEYWSKSPDGATYDRVPSVSLTRQLRIAGFSAKPGTGGNSGSSEVDHVLEKIERENKVDGVVEYLYHPLGRLPLSDGRIMLNRSRIRTVEPAPGFMDPGLPWAMAGSSFPFLHGLLTHLFDIPYPGQTPDKPSQLDFFIWWLAAFYQASYKRNPCHGQAMFVAGGAGQGKTFLGRHVLPPLMGGVEADVFSYLIGETKFTSDFAGQPILNIDDNSSSMTPALHQRVTLMLKSHVANGAMPFRKKGGIETDTPWYGRFFITLNTDRRSLGMIPDLDQSNRDKVMLMMTGQATKYQGFGTLEYNRLKVAEELPHLARYLLGVEIPERYRDNRFGVTAWQHPTLLNVSKAADSAGALLEGLTALFATYLKPSQVSEKLKSMSEAATDPGYWHGTAMSLMRDISAIMPSFSREYSSSRTLGAELGRLHQKGWDIVPEFIDKKSSVTHWKIAWNVCESGEDEARARAAEKAEAR